MTRQRAQDDFIEDLPDEAHALVRAQVHAIGRGDTGTFLAAMLQRVQTVVGQFRRIRMAVNAEQTTVMPWPHVFV
jgi:hypothetical protein